MPDPAGTHSDGGMQFGSQIAQIGAVNFVFEKISVKRGQRRILQNNESGVPKRKVHVRTLIEGSATIQYPDATTASPTQFAVFALVPAGGGTPVNFILEDVGEEFDHEGETKCQITFSEKLN
jgi:hypothetical protein